MRRETSGSAPKIWSSNLVDVVLEARRDGAVLVDDLVEDRVHDGARPEREELAVLLEAVPDGGEVG